ncbi:MAG: transposase, partial [Christensenellales bacterium]
KRYICKDCPHRARCTQSSSMTKVVTRHVWQDYMEMAEEFRLTLGMQEVYRRRKETIERVFADAKEKHGMRYTHYRGKAKLEFEICMTYAAMNLKKLAMWSARRPLLSSVRWFNPILFPWDFAKPVQAAA